MHLDPDPKTTVVGNGLTVVTDEMPGARSVTTGVWVGVGSRDEHDEISGVSHFLEHLFFKGTEERSARSIAEAVDAVGGEMNAYTAREHTAFYTRLPGRDWLMSVEMLGDLLSAPALRAHELDAEREVILEELWAALDTPEDRLHTLSMESHYPDHPIGKEVLGSQESVEAMTRDRVAEFFAEHYRPANIVIAAAGAVDHDELCAAVESRFVLPDGGARPDRVAPASPPQALAVLEREGEQVHVSMLWRGLAFDDDDRYAAYVANQILGGGSASRLFQSIREDDALAYSVYSWISTYSDTGLLGVYAGTSPGRSAVLLDRLDEELAQIRTGGVTPEELRVAIGYLAGSTELGLEDSGSRMVRLGRTLLAGAELVSVDEQLDRIRSVTLDDVHRVMARLLDAPRTVALVGPVDTASLSDRYPAIGDRA